MKPGSSFIILSFILAFFTPVVGRSQITSSNIRIDVPKYVAVVTGYPKDAIELAIPVATITDIINGSFLVGGNLAPTSPTVIGIPGLANLKVNWKVEAIKIPGETSPAIVLTVNAEPTIAGNSAPTSASFIVVRPDQVKTAALDKNYIQGMYSFWLYYYGGVSSPTGIYYSAGVFPYLYVWSVPLRTTSIYLGPTIYFDN